VHTRTYTGEQHVKNENVRDAFVLIHTHAHVHSDILVAWVANRKLLVRVELAMSGSVVYQEVLGVNL
jgi:hypothetical protein